MALYMCLLGGRWPRAPCEPWKRSSELSSHAATAAHRDLGRLAIELFPFAPFAERVWSLRSNLTSYEAWYVALAEVLELPLATLDRRLASSPGTGCDFVLPP